MVILRHVRIPGPTSYVRVSSIQESLVRSLLDAKKAHTSPPAPTIITTEFTPVYTCGRREVGRISSTQKSRLCSHGAEFHEALRGGQTTFHGPGQLIAYPIIDLLRHGLSARGYVSLLERSLINTCMHFGVTSMRTENPGVWTTSDDKIAALGVHLRRNVTSHGVGLNVSTDLEWFERIVACGLEGKRTTSLLQEGVKLQGLFEVVRQVFVGEFGKAIGAEKVEMCEVDELDLSR